MPRVTARRASAVCATAVCVTATPVTAAPVAAAPVTAVSGTGHAAMLPISVTRGGLACPFTRLGVNFAGSQAVHPDAGIIEP